MMRETAQIIVVVLFGLAVVVAAELTWRFYLRAAGVR